MNSQKLTEALRDCIIYVPYDVDRADELEEQLTSLGLYVERQDGNRYIYLTVLSF